MGTIKQNYSNLSRTLEKIQKEHIDLSQRMARRNTGKIMKTLKKLLILMRAADDIFDLTNPHIELMGDYFEGREINELEEYNVAVTLKIPYKKSLRKKIDLNPKLCTPQFTKVFLPETVPDISPESKVLFPEDVIDWMRTVAIKASNLLAGGFKSEINNIVVNTQNLIITTTYLKDPITVILVPVLLIPMTNRVKNSPVYFDKAENVFPTEPPPGYYLVPKTAEDKEIGWMITFPIHERRLFKGTHHLKNIYRLIRLLCNTQDMKEIDNYHLKTVFLWELSYNEAGFFQKNSKGDLFMHMLRSLRDDLKSGEITSYWCDDLDLLDLSAIDAAAKEKWNNKLTSIIKDIDANGVQNPNNIVKHFIKN